MTTLDNSSNTSSKLDQALDQFIDNWCQHQRHHSPQSMSIEYDSQWPSACYSDSQQLMDGELCQWQPERQQHQDMFSRLADALDEAVHPDIVTFYSRYWSTHLPATSDEGDLELLQVWNQDDMERLRSNLLGHALAKRKLKQPLSFFIALTYPDEGMLCVDNNSGEIWYEMPGKKPIRKIADSLCTFLSRIKPAVTDN
ncbi:MAG: hypothetical protein OFPI_21620 [Osedax symbiont Rs2]|nr:MAG: hypothetical protein OFPI_21620 [Osedax symbiont Rs2]